MTLDRDDIWTTAQAADFLGLHEATLRKWRVSDDGPVWTTMGGCVRYLRQDVEAWVLDNRRAALRG